MTRLEQFLHFMAKAEVIKVDGHIAEYFDATAGRIYLSYGWWTASEELLADAYWYDNALMTASHKFEFFALETLAP